jgi:hypothetical protein
MRNTKLFMFYQQFASTYSYLSQSDKNLYMNDCIMRLHVGGRRDKTATACRKARTGSVAESKDRFITFCTVKRERQAQ